MKTKNFILVIVLLITTLACSVSGIGTTESPAPTAAPAFTSAAPTNPPPTPILSQTVTMQSMPFNESSAAPVYTITAQIPNLQGSSDTRVMNFNSLLNQIVQDQIDQFRSDTIAFASNPPIAAGSSFDLQYSILGQRGDIWSIKFDVSIYVDGAAHPGQYSITLNYDLSNGREITLSELFLSNSNYIQVISDACKAQLTTRDIAPDMFLAGADPLPENYQLWNMSNEGLVITFNEYQVAPYAAGPQIVVIPYSELQSIIDPQSALELFAQ